MLLKEIQKKTLLHTDKFNNSYDLLYIINKYIFDLINEYNK